MIFSPLSLFALLQLAGSPATSASDFDPRAELLEDASVLVDSENLLGLVPLQPTGAARVPVLTVLGTTGSGGFLVQLQNSPTFFAEEFLIQLPPKPSKASPSPLLVAYHKFGGTVFDIPVNTTLEQECFDRNWFLVAPLGASTKSFSSIQSQLNTELVIEMVTSRFAGFIDPARIYGVGFSMGGGNAMNYAARHLDPARPMFAALINHSGPGSLRNGYEEEPPNQMIMDIWFGGPPQQFQFNYHRSSVLDIYKADVPGMPFPIPGAQPELHIGRQTSLITNLSHVPMYVVRGRFDPLTYINDQLNALSRYLKSHNFTHVYRIVPGVTIHSWSTLDEKVTLDWVSQFRLELPSKAFTIADRDDTYFHFDLEQSEIELLSSLEWEVRAGDNALDLFETLNIRRISFDLESTGLSASVPFTVKLTTADNEGDTLNVAGYTRVPREILRDGEPTFSWSFDEETEVLTLIEQDGSRPHSWLVVPATDE